MSNETSYTNPLSGGVYDATSKPDPKGGADVHAVFDRSPRSDDGADAGESTTDGSFSRRPYYDWKCQKLGELTHAEVETLAEVTFLDASDIKNIELLFTEILKYVVPRRKIWELLLGEGVWVRELGEHVPTTDEEIDEAIKARSPYSDLSKRSVDWYLKYLKKEAVKQQETDKGFYEDDTANMFEDDAFYEPESEPEPEPEPQEEESESADDNMLYVEDLRKHLAEFRHNIFLDRLVRTFSERGDSKLTMFELMDLYSALEPLATKQWKAKIWFCVLDFDQVRCCYHSVCALVKQVSLPHDCVQDGVLDQDDLVRAVEHMLLDTHQSITVSQQDAAVRIQTRWQGYKTRQYDLQEKEKEKEKKEKKEKEKEKKEKKEKEKEKKEKKEQNAHTKFKRDTPDERDRSAQMRQIRYRLALLTAKRRQGPIETYVAEVLKLSSSVRENVMEYREFVSQPSATHSRCV